jgi:hypothetical protein
MIKVSTGGDAAIVKSPLQLAIEDTRRILQEVTLKDDPRLIAWS